MDRSLLCTNVIRLFKFKIKSHLIDESQLNYQSMVILKHWHKLPLVENQIAPANSERFLPLAMTSNPRIQDSRDSLFAFQKPNKIVWTHNKAFKSRIGNDPTAKDVVK